MNLARVSTHSAGPSHHLRIHGSRDSVTSSMGWYPQTLLLCLSIRTMCNGDAHQHTVLHVHCCTGIAIATQALHVH